MRMFVFGLLVLVGCGDEPAPTSAPLPPVAPTAPSPPPRPTRIERVDAYPHFTDGELVTCTDTSFVMERPDGISEELEREFRDRSEMEARLPAEMLEHHRADQDCATVTRRVALATCSKQEVVHSEEQDHARGRRISSTTKTNWYPFGAVFETDEVMADCLSNGGTWDAVERNSTAALDAEGRHLARERERLEQRLGRRR